MKIAQNTQTKVKRMQALGQKVEFSEPHVLLDIESTLDTKNEFQQLYIKIENILKVFRLKLFHFSEENTRQYNEAALLKYKEVLDLYKKGEEEIAGDKSISVKQSWITKAKYKNVQRKWYNNMGWLYYALGDYAEAQKCFKQACIPEDAEELAVFSLIYETMQQITISTTEKSARKLNLSRTLIRQAEELKENKKDNTQSAEEEYLYLTAEKQINECRKGLSLPSKFSPI